MSNSHLPIPQYFDPKKVGQMWKVPYQQRAVEAKQWARQRSIHPAEID